MNWIRIKASMVATAMVAAATVPAVAMLPGGSMPEPAGTYARLPGVRLWYRDSGGSGFPVVLMHPATGSTDSWTYQYSALETAGYRVIAFDRRGSGRTTIEEGKEARSATDGEDLLSLVNFLQVGRFHLVGSAAGAFGALEFALSHPERLASLVIANSLGGVNDEDFARLGRRLRPSPQFDNLPVEFKELGPSYRASDPAGTQRWLEIYQSSVQEHPAGQQAPRYTITLSSLEKITVPTLLVTGGADLYAPPPIQELFRKRMPNATSVVVAEAGHSAFWERPQEFNQALLGFLKQH